MEIYLLLKDGAAISVETSGIQRFELALVCKTDLVVAMKQRCFTKWLRRSKIKGSG